MIATKKDQDRGVSAMETGYTHLRTVVSQYYNTQYFRHFPLIEMITGVDTNLDGRFFGSTPEQFKKRNPEAMCISFAKFKAL